MKNKTSKANMESPSKSKSAGKTTKIVLQNGRVKFAMGAAVATIAGGLCLSFLGTIGQGIGIFLLLIAGFQGYKAVRTFIHAPGTFSFSEGTIQLPTSLCSGETLSLQPSDIQHAFFVRRVIPWTQAGPILVVEAKDQSYWYPRDWFESDSDQLRVARAMNKQIAAA